MEQAWLTGAIFLFTEALSILANSGAKSWGPDNSDNYFFVSLLFIVIESAMSLKKTQVIMQSGWSGNRLRISGETKVVGHLSFE